ncbi:hypothetical protein DH2020_032011 [Rehmannia glutinosa]|uniref:Uncharacterized protein n=1 Tax=Rehmannia glutinosa TaxID=99300 RepID=A0ABR0VJG3_REHGL
MPQYPEMIMAAIEALNDKNGSNKSTTTSNLTQIPRHVAAVDGPLCLKLLCLQELFRRPPKSQDPTAPPPLPKPKAATSTATVSGRKRGRPSKTATAGVAAPPLPPPASSGAPRGRGRPPKVKPAMAAPVGA